MVGINTYTSNIAFLACFTMGTGAEVANSLNMLANTGASISSRTISTFSQNLKKHRPFEIRNFNQALTRFGESDFQGESAVVALSRQYLDLVEHARTLSTNGLLTVRAAALETIRRGSELILRVKESRPDDSYSTALRGIAESYIVSNPSIKPTEPVMFAIAGEKLFMGMELPITEIARLSNAVNGNSKKTRDFLRMLLNGTLDGHMLMLDPRDILKVKEEVIEEDVAVLSELPKDPKLSKSQRKQLERKEFLVKYLQEHGSISTTTYTRFTVVSEPTAKNDLRKFRELGLIESQGRGMRETHRLLENADK